MVGLSFVFCLLVFVLIGLASKLKSQETSVDYLLASHDVKPWQAALSAIATNNSGYMFIGMIGYTYHVGIASIWLAVGWILGDFIASMFIHRSLRVHTTSSKSTSFPSVLAKWNGTTFHWVRRIAGLITLIFLGTYAAAQLNAGSKALHVLFEWHYATGAIIGAFIVVVYCYAGGIRASIWTDVAQSLVMILAMAMICIASFYEIENIGTLGQQLSNLSPTYLNLFPTDMIYGPVLGAILFVTGWLFAGFSVVGQPHIMVRFMSLDNPKHMKQVRIYYYSWYVAFYAFTIIAGIAARLLIKEVNFDAELALPLLAMKFFPPLLVGLVLAGLFSATMSTADSQILSCAASLTKDIFEMKDRYWINKAATLSVAAFALLIALYGNKSVFTLIVFAWSVLGASFAPLLTVYALKKPVSEPLACAMILTGMLVVLLWGYVPNSEALYSACPGILSGFVVYGIGRYLPCFKPTQSIRTHSVIGPG